MRIHHSNLLFGYSYLRLQQRSRPLASSPAPLPGRIPLLILSLPRTPMLVAFVVGARGELIVAATV